MIQGNCRFNIIEEDGMAFELGHIQRDRMNASTGLQRSAACGRDAENLKFVCKDGVKAAHCLVAPYYGYACATSRSCNDS